MPKKKTALTIEERLQQALVPAEEQPYEVPENWVWVRLGSFIDLLRGVSYKKHDVHNEKMENDCLILRGGNIIEGGLDLNADNVYVDKSLVSEAQLIRRNDIIIVSSTGSVKVIGRAGLAFCDYNDVAFGAFLTLARPKNRCNKSFVDLFFQSFLYRQRIRELASGVNINNIRSEYITNMQFPLPPLSEQQRIVERIEELFAKLDEAKERLQEVADSFAVRKAAILHKAFTGELTKKHEIEDSIVIRDKLFAERENMVQEKVLKRVKIKPLIQDEYKSQLAKNWVQCKLGEVAFVTKLAGFEYTKYIHLEDTGEIPVVRAQNVRKGYLDTTNLLYISKSVSDALSRSALKEKSVLITFIGAGIGDACVFDENQQYHLAPNVAKVEPFNKSEEKLNVYFLLYYLLSSFGQYEIFKNMKATAQPSLSMETIREIIIPLPSIEEQHEIVRLIDDLLARERAAQQAAEQALASIDLMKKSILARAFRGELGTNKASEASALELLKQVLAEN